MNEVIGAEIVLSENEDARKQSMLIVKSRKGKYIMITASNSRRFLMSQINENEITIIQNKL